MRRAAIVLVTALAACTSSHPSSSTPVAAPPPSASHRFPTASALELARHIPGCVHASVERSADPRFRTAARCTSGDTHVTIRATLQRIAGRLPENYRVDPSDKNDFVIVGAGWVVFVHGTRSAAQQIAHALGGTAE